MARSDARRSVMSSIASRSVVFESPPSRRPCEHSRSPPNLGKGLVDLEAILDAILGHDPAQG